MEKPRIDNDHEFSPVYDSIKERAAKKQGRCLFLVVNLTILLASAFAVLYFVLPTFSSADLTVTGRRYRHHHHHHKHHHNEPVGKGHDRPPYNEKAKMARYIVHESEWAMLTTFCTHNKGYPWGELVSVTDGLENNSTGIPLIYVSSMDAAAHDLEKNSNVSFSFSEAQGDWCRNHDVDPEDPRCAKVHLFGKMVKLTPGEIPAAKKAMFTKHPVMAKWPPSHKFFFAKIELTRVEVLDFFGPLSLVPVKDYLNAKF